MKQEMTLNMEWHSLHARLLLNRDLTENWKYWVGQLSEYGLGVLLNRSGGVLQIVELDPHQSVPWNVRVHEPDDSVTDQYIRDVREQCFDWFKLPMTRITDSELKRMRVIEKELVSLDRGIASLADSIRLMEIQVVLEERRIELAENAYLEQVPPAEQYRVLMERLSRNAISVFSVDGEIEFDEEYDPDGPDVLEDGEYLFKPGEPPPEPLLTEFILECLDQIDAGNL